MPVDDFIALVAQQEGSPAHANRGICRILLHTIDGPFRPNDSSNPEGCRKVISLKKLLNGDACWSTLKVVLLVGWSIDDSVRKTIESLLATPPPTANCGCLKSSPKRRNMAALESLL
jgi:hypothetical protein